MSSQNAYRARKVGGSFKKQAPETKKQRTRKRNKLEVQRYLPDIPGVGGDIAEKKVNLSLHRKT